MEAIMNTIVIDNNLAVKVSTYLFESALKLLRFGGYSSRFQAARSPGRLHNLIGSVTIIFLDLPAGSAWKEGCWKAVVREKKLRGAGAGILSPPHVHGLLV
jgi:hypothetical protein